ncbi:hypothetical protein K4G93_24875, partial [Mycobacterium tuberculosis]|nr:hypothetical protein [Mycobacterium tuberculosis]
MIAIVPAVLAAQEHDHAGPSSEKLGRVQFANSCSADVQPDLQRAVAMLHSFRYKETEKAFAAVLARDPS